MFSDELLGNLRNILMGDCECLDKSKWRFRFVIFWPLRFRSNTVLLTKLWQERSLLEQCHFLLLFLLQLFWLFIGFMHQLTSGFWTLFGSFYMQILNIWVVMLFPYLTIWFIAPLLIFVHNEGPLGWKLFKLSLTDSKNVKGIYPYVTCKGSLPLIPCGPVPKMESDSPWLLPICTS